MAPGADKMALEIGDIVGGRGRRRVGSEVQISALSTPIEFGREPPPQLSRNSLNPPRVSRAAF